MESGQNNVIINSLLAYAFCNNIEIFSLEELKHICDVVDYNSIPDRYLTDNPGLYPFIRWDRLEKMKAVRLSTVNKEILQKINLKQYTFKVKEIFFLIKNDHTILYSYFNFDFSTISQEDAYYLLCLGKKDLFDLIDVRKYKFTFIETFDIIRAYNYDRAIIETFKYDELKSYQITEILANTGYESRDLFNLNVLTTLNWLELLCHKPEFLKECDFNKFIVGDPFNLIQLVILFDRPDLSHLLSNIDLEDITAFGWEKLLIYKPEEFASKCNFKKLNESNWLEILHHQPSLSIYKI